VSAHTAVAHTPGPWAVSDNHGKRYIEPVGDNEPVAQITKGPNSEANARLIAAAPELLEALVVMCREFELKIPDHCNADWYEEFNAARAAIAKATGITP
jgi:hypothetical protein